MNPSVVSPKLPSCSLVILDDNYVIRSIIKNELYRNASNLFPSVLFDIYSSDDGVGGLGYVFITKPTVVIVDTTLPRYSGKEIFEFLKTNQNNTLQNTKIILISEFGTAFEQLPNNFLILDKSNPGFLKSLISLSTDHLVKELTTKRIANPDSKKKVNVSLLGKFVVFMANFADKINSPKALSKNSFLIFLRPFAWFIWVLLEIFTVPFLIAYNLSIGNVLGESQIKTANASVNYRSSRKPQFITFFENIFLTIVKLTLFLIVNIAILLISREI
ncbi:response regulator [Candidatus Dojkabacteria bacterium]|uniref:Response regulator n=1 Tax=Candidatus Dojkabacteria bacterium TaxID=2099670 RepID=A0A955RL05_9BACT|nr:response regulator [Candidatus Dojkabacteria bacterium]